MDAQSPAPETGASASLTYEPFYRLREKAFSLSADPRFLFRSPAHAPAFDALLVGIRRREGLIVLTGEIGSGKTTVCRSVLQQLDRRTFAAFVPDPFVSREDLLKTLLVDFGVVSISDLKANLQRASRLDLSYLLYEFLDSLVPLQAFAVLIIDEAQNLTLPLLEEIRILSELERREKLLQVVLVGQPELRANLKLPQMRQVDQRVSVRHELTALGAGDVAAYVRHRLRVASDGECSVDFPLESMAAIYQGSAGVPRVINHICDRAMQRAYVSRAFRVAPQYVWDAIADLGLQAQVTLPPAPVLTSPVIASAVPTPAPSPGVVPAPEPMPAPVPAPEPPAASAPLHTAAGSVALADEFLSDESGLPEFVTERAPAPARVAAARPAAPRTNRKVWRAAAAALVAAGAVATAGVTLLRTDAVDAAAVAALRPAPAAIPLRPVETPRMAEEPAPAADAAPPAENTTAATGGDYLIQVAWFSSLERAERLVGELTTAGFRARHVARDFGPPRGRLLQVIVGGYSSALEVERDLRRIRELPGYADSHVLVP